MDFSFVYGLVAGCLSGAVGKFYVQKLFDRTKKLEGNKSKQLEWDKIDTDYPRFMNQLRLDINNPENKNIREFFVVDQNAVLHSQIPRLRYDLTEDILPAVNRLEHLGYIEKIKNNCLLYKMHEEFVNLLRTPINL